MGIWRGPNQQHSASSSPAHLPRTRLYKAITKIIRRLHRRCSNAFAAPYSADGGAAPDISRFRRRPARLVSRSGENTRMLDNGTFACPDGSSPQIRLADGRRFVNTLRPDPTPRTSSTPSRLAVRRSLGLFKLLPSKLRNWTYTLLYCGSLSSQNRRIYWP